MCYFTKGEVVRCQWYYVNNWSSFWLIFKKFYFENTWRHLNCRLITPAYFMKYINTSWHGVKHWCSPCIFNFKMKYFIHVLHFTSVSIFPCIKIVVLYIKIHMHIVHLYQDLWLSFPLVKVTIKGKNIRNLNINLHMYTHLYNWINSLLVHHWSKPYL